MVTRKFALLCICLPLCINSRIQSGCTYLERPNASPWGKSGCTIKVPHPTVPRPTTHVFSCPPRCSHSPHHSPTPSDLHALGSNANLQWATWNRNRQVAEMARPDVRGSGFVTYGAFLRSSTLPLTLSCPAMPQLALRLDGFQWNPHARKVQEVSHNEREHEPSAESPPHRVNRG